MLDLPAKALAKLLIYDSELAKAQLKAIRDQDFGIAERVKRERKHTQSYVPHIRKYKKKDGKKVDKKEEKEEEKKEKEVKEVKEKSSSPSSDSFSSSSEEEVGNLKYCPHCPFKTRRSVLLRQHERIHASSVPAKVWKCPSCNFEARWRNALVQFDFSLLSSLFYRSYPPLRPLSLSSSHSLFSSCSLIRRLLHIHFSFLSLLLPFGRLLILLFLATYSSCEFLPNHLSLL